MKRIAIFVGLVLMSIPHNLIQLPKKQIVQKTITVKKKKALYDLVTVTTYSVTPEQTDSTPLITASGFKIDSLNPRRHRIIAVSRDLKRKYRFGQKVRVEGAGRLNGVYVIRDLMASRWKKKIDILINPDDKHTKLTGVRLYRVES